MERVAIIGAMDEEVALYKKTLHNSKKVSVAGFDFFIGELHGKEVIVMKSGAGKVNASAGAQILIDKFSPSALIFTGVAGGLNPSLNIHDILIGKDSLQHDMDAQALGFEPGCILFSDMREFSSNKTLLDIAKESAKPLGASTVEGRILSGDQFISDKKKALLLREKFGGDCVDMETAAVAQVCLLNKVPFIAIRSISDKADGTASADFGQFLKKASENSFALVSAMLGSISKKYPKKGENSDIKSHIRTIPNWPKTGIMFRDITTLLKSPQGFRKTLDSLENRYKGMQIDVIVGIESRGFILGAALADRLGTGFVPIRKKNKLPAKKISQEYALEYGTDCIEIHEDAISEGARVLLIDDLVATGGTALAACNLLKKIKGNVVECAFVIDLPDLGGRKKIEDAGYKTHALLEFAGE